MTTENARLQAQELINRKNASYHEIVTAIDANLDILNHLLSSTGKAGGTEDSATDTAVTAAKVQTAIITGRINVLFVTNKYDGSITPEFISAVVADATPTKITLTFNTEVALTDATGFTVSGSTLATSISSAVVETDKTLVTLTANGAVANGETVLISYNGSTGNVVSDADAAKTITDGAVTNNVA